MVPFLSCYSNTTKYLSNTSFNLQIAEEFLTFS